MLVLCVRWYYESPVNACKPTLNATAICITDDTVLHGLKRKKVEKAAAEKKKKRQRDLGENVIRKSEKRNN